MFLTSRGTLASCLRQEETRDKRVPFAAAGSGPLKGKLAPEYPKWSGCQSQRRRVPDRVAICCRKGDSKLGSCLIFGNELSKEAHVLTKQEVLLGKGTQVKSSRVREPKSLSRVQLFCNHMDYSLPSSMGFPRPEYQIGSTFSLPENLPDLGIKPASPALTGGFFTTETPGNPKIEYV